MPEQNPKRSSPKKQLDSYARYSGMAVMMGATIALGAWGGTKLDAWMGNVKFPVFTLVLTLTAVFVSIYYFIRDFLKPTKKK